MTGEGQEGHVYVAADLEPVAVVVQTLGVNRLNILYNMKGCEIKNVFTFSRFISVISWTA